MRKLGGAALKRLVLETLGWLLVVVGIAALVLPGPDWWGLDDSWWLVGGFATGATQIGSGIIALALIIYSYRRFRRPDGVTTAER